MTAIHTNLSKAHGKVEAMCESCSGDKAEAFCRQCAEFICADCVRSHQKMKAFAGHRTTSLAELKEGGAKNMVLQETPRKMCEKHDEQMKIYCFDCNCLICRDCIIKDHNGHNHEFIKEAAPIVKKELLEQLDPLKDVKVNLSHAIEEINITKSDVKVQVSIATKHIKKSFEELRQILANREQELLEETTAKEAQKLEKLSAQEKKLSTSSAVVQNVIEYTKQCLEHSTYDDIMSMRAEMQSRIKREVTKHGDGYKPVEEADMKVDVNCSDNLKQLCQTNAKLTQLPIKYTVTGINRFWSVNVAQNIMVTAKNQGGRHNRPIQGLTCQVKMPDIKQDRDRYGDEYTGVAVTTGATSGTTTRTCHAKNMNDEYHIQYTPNVCGIYQIMLTVGGQPIAGSTFHVNVHN